jgi:hypothetical protein
MGLLDFFRRKKKPSGPTLKGIWRGFQQVLALNNEAQILMDYLEVKLEAPEDLDLNTWRMRIDLLDRRFADLVAAILSMSGSRWAELENSRTRIRETIQQRLAELSHLSGSAAVDLEKLRFGPHHAFNPAGPP